MLSVNIELLADINEGEGSSAIPTQEAVEFGDHLYFAADDGFAGIELWRTDGTTEGTELVADIFPGEFSSQPTEFVVYQDELYFAATDGDGDELWKTDGTDAGTVQVVDVWQGPDSSFPSDLVVFQDSLYFAASDGIDGDELWRTDGTEAGTELLVDIVPGEVSSYPSFPYVFEDELFFAANVNDLSGPELWKTDGTADGTVLVKDILEGEEGSFPEAFFAFQDELFFVATETVISDFGFIDFGLYKTDGTEEGTVRIMENHITFDLDNTPNIIELNGFLYYGGINFQRGWELFRTDGTVGNSELVHDLAGAFESVPASFELLNGEIFFSANTETGRELFKTDGTNFQQLTDTDNSNPNVNGISASDLIRFGDQILFVGNEGDAGWQVYGTDGNTVEQLSNLDAQQFPGLPPNFVFFEFGDRILFRGAEDDIGLELWTITSTDERETLPGDIDNDGMVAFSDFLILSSNFQQTGVSDQQGDIDGDGQVQFSDFLLLAANFGKSLP